MSERYHNARDNSWEQPDDKIRRPLQIRTDQRALLVHRSTSAVRRSYFLQEDIFRNLPLHWQRRPRPPLRVMILQEEDLRVRTVRRRLVAIVDLIAQWAIVGS